MRKLSFLPLLLFFMSVHSQCGVYLTADDFKNGKVSDACKSFTKRSQRGADALVLHTETGNKVYEMDKIWGYKKDDLNDVCIVKNETYVVVGNGPLYFFPCKIEDAHRKRNKKGEIIYYKSGVNAYASVDLSKAPVRVRKMSDLLDLMDEGMLKKVKEHFNNNFCGVENQGLNFKEARKIPERPAMIEEVVDYYNSLFPGYRPFVYDTYEFVPR